MNVIEVENLTKDYGSGRGVFDVSFHVGKGKYSGFWDQTEQENLQRSGI